MRPETLVYIMLFETYFIVWALHIQNDVFSYQNRSHMCFHRYLWSGMFVMTKIANVLPSEPQITVNQLQQFSHNFLSLYVYEFTWRNFLIAVVVRHCYINKSTKYSCYIYISFLCVLQYFFFLRKHLATVEILIFSRIYPKLTFFYSRGSSHCQ